MIWIKILKWFYAVLHLALWRSKSSICWYWCCCFVWDRQKGCYWWMQILLDVIPQSFLKIQRLRGAVILKSICNCSEPSIFLQLNVMNACIRERLAVKIYLADTPHRKNASFWGWLWTVTIEFNKKKKRISIPDILFIYIWDLFSDNKKVAEGRFELSTPRVWTVCSSQLSYSAT